MGMSDEQFEVYNALLNFVDKLILNVADEDERKKLQEEKQNILANNRNL